MVNNSPEKQEALTSATSSESLLLEFPLLKTSPLEIDATQAVIYTIISKNYLAHARVLMSSIRQFHPEINLVTILVDQVDGYFQPEDEPCQFILASELGIPNWRHFSMKYDIMELNTAVKPYAAELLMSAYGAQKVIYFDPDICVYHDLNALLDLLDKNLCVLTPHITEPVSDGFSPNEIDYLKVGTYNLGFFALSRHGDWEGLLHWWQERLYEHCTREVERGLFVDQNWMDLVPALFETAHILRTPTYNVAYWNLLHRQLSLSDEGTYLVDDQPLIFFHFSGFSVTNPDMVSKHQNRFVMSDLSPATQQCFMDYRQRLLEAGSEETQKYPYAYAYFSDGVPIPDVLRVCLRQHDSRGELWPDPYDIEAPNSFRRWASFAGAIAPYRYLSPMAISYYRIRTDLHALYPRIGPGNEWDYANWFVQQDFPKDVFHPLYVSPVRDALSDNDDSQEIAPFIPLKKNEKQNRYIATVEYFSVYPHRVKPFLPPEAFKRGPTIYLGPTNFYARMRQMLAKSGLLPPIRRVVGLRIILTIRQYFSYPLDPLDYRVEEAIVGVVTTSDTDAEESDEPSRGQVEPGVTVVGYLSAETGVGQIARGVIKSLQFVGFPVSGKQIDVYGTYRQQDNSVSQVKDAANHFIQLFNINADQSLPTYRSFGRKFYEGHYNIGYWFWELSQFPRLWDSALDLYQEIWTASDFVQQAVQANTSLPVHKLPVSIEVPLPERSDRESLGLPAEGFIVLFSFDALSIVERKNPWAVIRAFEQAFSADERGKTAHLVLKVTNLHKVDEESRLLRQLSAVNGILIDKYMHRLEVNSLLNQCNVYISLHRSEGFGLGMAEAMYLGRPVIATAYSGNMDFMTAQNSYLVPYQLVKLDQTYPPYDQDNVWASPDVEAAAAHLRHVYDHYDEALEVGKIAASDIRAQYSPLAVGKQLAARLQNILDSHDLERSDPAFEAESAIFYAK